jgi:hypothetical protein
MKRSETISVIASALLKAQKKMGAAVKGADNPFFKSKYADLSAVMEVVKEPLNAEGIAVLQSSYSVDGKHYVETTLLHESGEFISSGPLQLELSRVDMQSLGSAISYSKRYQLQSLAFVPAEDDDGEKAVSRPNKAPSKESSPVKEVPSSEPKKPSFRNGTTSSLNFS